MRCRLRYEVLTLDKDKGCRVYVKTVITVGPLNRTSGIMSRAAIGSVHSRCQKMLVASPAKAINER
jgi:hypothetical protein